MARTRTIKPHFLRSRSMRAVSPLARLTFVQLWLLADDAGRVADASLARRLYPGDAAAAAQLPDWLGELERQHCIERYTVDRLDYLRIVNWHRHQKIYHPTPSRLPARPPGAGARESAAHRERFGRERGECPPLRDFVPSARIPECFAAPRETLGKNPPTPCAAGPSPAFTSVSGEKEKGVLRRATGLARRLFRPATGRGALMGAASWGKTGGQEELP